MDTRRVASEFFFGGSSCE